MGLSPKLWGNSGWKFIHYVACAYPENPTHKDKIDYYIFFNSLENVLPCPFCAENYKKKVEKNLPNLNSRKELFEWTVDIHNSVNREHGKPELSYEDAIKVLFPKKIDLEVVPYALPTVVVVLLTLHTLMKKR
jgi:hypothetical protein